MITIVLGIVSSILVMVIGVWKYFGLKSAERRKQAEQARKDLDNANSESGSASDFLDGFGRMCN
jgi:hypothetical protein